MRVVAVFLALLVLLAVACSDDESTRSRPDSSGADLSSCSNASSALLTAIEQGLTVTGGGSLSEGATVKSADFSEVWFVAAEIDGPGMEGGGEVGVWATNSLSGSGSIFAVNAIANEFSDWADGRTTDAALSMSDDGAREAEDCL